MLKLASKTLAHEVSSLRLYGFDVVLVGARRLEARLKNSKLP